MIAWSSFLGYSCALSSQFWSSGWVLICLTHYILKVILLEFNSGLIQFRAFQEGILLFGLYSPLSGVD